VGGLCDSLDEMRASAGAWSTAASVPQLLREVVHEDPRVRYRIEWDDGRTSVYTPAAGALQLAHETAKRAGWRLRAAVDRNGSNPRTVTTTSGPIKVERPRVRNAQALGMGR
jgi:hypothetical protein